MSQERYAKWAVGVCAILMVVVSAAQVMPADLRSGFNVLTSLVAVLAVVSMIIDVA